MRRVEVAVGVGWRGGGESGPDQYRCRLREKIFSNVQKANQVEYSCICALIIKKKKK